MSELTVIQDSQITNIEPRGITYTDENGDEQFIDFMKCYANYLQGRLNREAYLHHKELNSMMETDVLSYVDKLVYTRVIRHRNKWGNSYSHDKPYMEFFTQPMTVIVFSIEDKYGEIWVKARRNRWHLSDMT